MEDLLEKEMATYCSILAWRITWTEEPGGLQSMGLQRVGHDWVTTHTNTLMALILDPWPFSLAICHCSWVHIYSDLCPYKVVIQIHCLSCPLKGFLLTTVFQSPCWLFAASLSLLLSRTIYSVPAVHFHLSSTYWAEPPMNQAWVFFLLSEAVRAPLKS